MKNKILDLVERICTNTKSTDCRGLNNKEVARELMNVAHIPTNAEIVEIPLNWNNQVVILFLLPEDKNYYSLFAGIGNDGNFHFDLSIAGTLQENGYFDFFAEEEMLPINYFETELKEEKLYTTYEQTADKETAGKDTRTESEWFLYYLLWIDRAEYPDFITWLADMVKTGNLIEEEEEERKMSKEEMIEYLLEELKEEETKMLQSKENKYGYIFMLCNDMGIIPDE